MPIDRHLSQRAEGHDPTAGVGRLPARTMIHLLGCVLALLLAAWTAVVALECARVLWAGGDLQWDVLLRAPTSLSNLITLPIMAGAMLIDRLANGPDRFVMRDLLHRTRYDLFFVLADATGAMTALALVFSFGFSAWIGTAIAGAPSVWLSAMMPFWLQVPAVFLAATFAAYWGHRFMHTRLMWPLHAIHHAATDLTALTDSRQHPLDDLIKSMPVMLVLAVMGFDPDAVFVAALIGRLQAAFIHSNAPCPLWLERWVIAGPALHRVHHGAAPEHHDRNYAALVLWDRLFGTFSLPDDARSVRTGIDNPRTGDQGPVRDMLAAGRAWLEGLVAAMRRVAMPSAPVSCSRTHG
ncbi:sterol desaturase family protein [Reyranella sp. CPCC 100927]|uniref:sterol desaturase family protein n=1 Tax=Reyranella sp. CPCC 100927 TaxID=2599616 RepID=UPI0011B5D68C|nr:sterol desaturase family protein [Reyranella sp. CPCC 100927]TWT14907.1 sterol desaturase family protein [Reyranella sp. CPCC 100927]